jgi:Abortive infection C-terminus
VQVVNGLAAIRNMASDGHARQVEPHVRHARVAVNSAKTVASFLVEVYLARPVGVAAAATTRVVS